MRKTFEAPEIAIYEFGDVIVTSNQLPFQPDPVDGGDNTLPFQP
jgi:hypothetical protein